MSNVHWENNDKTVMRVMVTHGKWRSDLWISMYHFGRDLKCIGIQILDIFGLEIYLYYHPK